MSNFPAMAVEEDYLRLSGYLHYQPWVRFPEEVMEELQEILESACDIDGCENPEVIADWRECVRNEQRLITHRSEILFYRDGGDWAEEENGHHTGIGVLFARRNIDQTAQPNSITYHVHIPDEQWQDVLLPCCDFLEELKQGAGIKLLRIRSYLDGVINDQSVWEQINND